MTANDIWEGGTDALYASRPRRMVAAVTRRIGRINMARRSKKQRRASLRSVGDRLYDLFLDADRQYSCAYFTDPANSLEQAQLDKKAHIAAKLD